MKIFIVCIIIVVFVALPVLGCDQVPANTLNIEADPVVTELVPTQAFVVTEEPRNTPEASSIPSEKEIYDEYCCFVEQEFIKAYRVDLSEIAYRTCSPFASEIQRIRELLLLLPGQIETDAKNLFNDTISKVSTDSSIINKPISVDFECESPSWRCIAAMTWAYGVEKVESMLQTSARVSVTVEDGAAKMSLLFPAYDELTEGTDLDKHFSADFVYNYFTTVYNDNFEKVDYVSPPLPDGYIYTVGLPLQRMLYYNTWYGNRQSNTRVHLGQDVRAKPGTDIFSCTDGTVTAIGYDSIAGNYVVVLDNYGYEYHYYHMVVLTDFLCVGDSVCRGDAIGRVGATGNSDANHLHLAIVAPNHVYLNPFELMCMVRDLDSEPQLQPPEKAGGLRAQS